MPEPFVLLNGSYVPASAARVSVLDRGFLYGDAIFSTMRTYGGRLAHFPDHFRRMSGNLESLGIEISWNSADLLGQINELLRLNGLKDADAIVRVQVSRGVGDKLGLKDKVRATPTVFALAYAIDAETLSRRGKGVSLASVPGLHAGGAARLKIAFYAKNLLCARIAKTQGADDGVFIDGEGRVAEASTANIFFIQDGRAFTPSLDVGALPGITRAHILALCKANSIPAEEGAYAAARFQEADEVFLTASVSEIVPVSEFDKKPVRYFGERPVTRRLHRLYDELTAKSLSPKGDFPK